MDFAQCVVHTTYRKNVNQRKEEGSKTQGKVQRKQSCDASSFSESIFWVGPFWIFHPLFSFPSKRALRPLCTLGFAKAFTLEYLKLVYYLIQSVPTSLESTKCDVLKLRKVCERSELRLQKKLYFAPKNCFLSLFCKL